MDKTIIGNNFKRICEERKVSQNELERRTGIAQGTVSKFMKGGDGTIDTMCRLCEGLGISPAELFDDKIFRTEGTRIAHAFLALIENRILFPPR